MRNTIEQGAIGISLGLSKPAAECEAVARETLGNNTRLHYTTVKNYSTRFTGPLRETKERAQQDTLAAGSRYPQAFTSFLDIGVVYNNGDELRTHGVNDGYHGSRAPKL